MGLIDFFRFSRKKKPPLRSNKGRANDPTYNDSFRKASSGSIPKRTLDFFKERIEDYRYNTNIDTLLDDLYRVDSDIGNAVWNFIITAASGVKIDAKNYKGEKHKVGTNKLLAIVDRLKGYAIDRSLDTLIPAMIQLTVVRGGFGLELRTDEEGRINELFLIDPKWIDWRREDGRFVPYQSGKSVESEYLFWGLLNPDVNNPNPISMLLTALQTVFFRMGVLQDLEKVVSRAGYAKLKAKIVEDVMVRNAPANIRRDSEKLRAYLNTELINIQTFLTQLRPEDAVAHFDSVEIDYLQDGFKGQLDVNPLMKVLDQQISSGLKTLPSILGRGSNSNDTESVLYVRGARYIQGMVAITLSNALTFALEREGANARANVVFNEVDLRAPLEIENHKLMKQKRILELVVLGFETPEVACYELTGHELPSYYKEEWIDAYRESHLGLNAGTTDDDWSDNGTYYPEAEDQEPGKDTIDTRTDDEKEDNNVKDNIKKKNNNIKNMVNILKYGGDR